MKKIFLSYSYSEIEKLFVDRLQKELEVRGNQIINTTESINLGQSCVDTIHNDINKCDIVIAVLGNNLNVAYEIGYAIGKSKKVLIIVNNNYKVPFNLETIPSIFMRNNEINMYDYDDTINEILDFIDNMENSQEEMQTRITKYLLSQFQSLEDNNNKYRIFLFNDHDSKHDTTLSDWIKLRSRENPKKLEDPTLDCISKISLIEPNYTNFFNYIEPTDFEDLICKLLKNRKFNLIKSEKYSGYDFVLSNYKTFQKTLVEVKNSNINNKISVGLLQRFLDVIHFNKADSGIFISSSGYTRSAMDFAEHTTPKIELWDMNTIKQLLSEEELSEGKIESF